MGKKDEVEKYLEKASDWDIDQVYRSKNSETKAWRVAGISTVITLISVSANLMLFPLKTVEDRIIRVDSVTGVVDVIRDMSDAKTTYSEETDKYWLAQYVRAREGFRHDDYQRNYRQVSLLSSASEQKIWFDYYNPKNPTAPINTLTDGLQKNISIVSTSFVSKGVASVRYTVSTGHKGEKSTDTHYIATIKYRYVKAPQTDTSREINPIGFQVTDYRTDQEADVTTTGGIIVE
jgi:type IV secretion system protein VirB8